MKTVLFYSIDTVAERILQVLRDDNQNRKFTFVASEAWGTNDKLISGQLGDEAAGSLVFVTNASFNIDDSFKLFLRNVTLSSESRNPWLKQYLAAAFNCDLEGSFVRTKSTCNVNQHLADDTVESIASDQRIVHVSHSVYAVREGILATCSSPCANLRTQEKATELTGNIRQVELSGQDGQRFKLFTDEGNGYIGFNIFNIQRDEYSNDKVYFYSEVRPNLLYT